MRRLLLLIPVLLVVALAIPAASSGTHRAAKTFTIKVGDDFFSPTKKTVHRNDIVKWVWVGADGKPGDTVNEHTVVEKTGEKLPKLNSKTRTSGSYRFRFKKAGKFTIICADHPDTMVMTVKVTR